MKTACHLIFLLGIFLKTCSMCNINTDGMEGYKGQTALYKSLSDEATLVQEGKVIRKKDFCYFAHSCCRF